MQAAFKPTSARVYTGAHEPVVQHLIIESQYSEAAIELTQSGLLSLPDRLGVGCRLETLPDCTFTAVTGFPATVMSAFEQERQQQCGSTPHRPASCSALATEPACRRACLRRASEPGGALMANEESIATSSAPADWLAASRSTDDEQLHVLKIPASSWSTFLSGLVLAKVTRDLPPRHLQVLRLVCRGWSEAIAGYLRHLRPDHLDAGRLVQRCPALCSLDLSFCNQTVSICKPCALEGRAGSGFEMLLRLSSLVSLNLSGCTALLPEAGQALSRWECLTALDLHNCPLGGDEGLRQLQGMQHLKRLELGGACAQLTDAGMQSLVRLRALEQCEVRRCAGLTDAGVLALAEAPGLRRLHVMRCPGVSKVCIQGLARRTNITAVFRLASLKSRAAWHAAHRVVEGGPGAGLD